MRKRQFLAALMAGGFLLAGWTGAPADADDVEMFTAFTPLEDGTSVGVSSDGAWVLYSTRFATIPPESLITAEDILAKPYLKNNVELYSWEPRDNRVNYFTTSALVENSGGTALAIDTINDSPSLDSKTFSIFSSDADLPTRTTVRAVAFRTNAPQDTPGPVVSIDEVDGRIATLTGEDDRTIFVWDSEDQTFYNVFETLLTPLNLQLGPPSLAMHATRKVDRIPNHRGEVAVETRLREVWVAFAGSGDPINENSDLNDEVFLWRRSEFIADREEEGSIAAAGVRQITHTTGGAASWSPVVNRRGEVAFVSNGNLTGNNPDGSEELFVWSNGRTRQITNIPAPDEGSIGGLCWAAHGRVLAFHSDGDLVRRNPDRNLEIFVLRGRRLRQITNSLTGDSTDPSVGERGRRIAFRSDANTRGVTATLGTPELVVASRSGRRTLQVTQTLDGGLNEAPTISHDGRNYLLTWVSDSDFVGRNVDGSRRIYRTQVKGRLRARNNVPAPADTDD